MDEKQFLKNFGRRIKYLRTQLGMSQTDLANKINELSFSSTGGTSKQVISNLESGQKFVSAKTLLLISTALEQPCFELFVVDSEDQSLEKRISSIVRSIQRDAEKELAIELLLQLASYSQKLSSSASDSFVES